MKLPIIGLTTEIRQDGDIHVNKKYVEAVSDLGGVPMLLPKTTHEEAIREQVNRIDGLYLTGGTDIDPAIYDEEPHPKLGRVESGRDEHEIKILEYAIERGIPILAICRGSQLLNIIHGGSMYQDIESELDGDLIQHKMQSDRDFIQHSLTVEPDTKLYHITNETHFRVNSVHHQANDEIGEGLIVSAKAPDGVIEAIESTDDNFKIGLQFHPEELYHKHEPSKKIIAAFIEAAAKKTTK
ncbi:gamma-glutamyl-gamma-aminobutyrate hydrolase family protein [Macrococcus brunensis]|uniref:gamma-glutamyl-gamma-aminobutyrate hydrolase family protein n=1 Tax=Macrococcus brunensis TaxID=198483 RepID=UPI001EEF9653|nr:gamma-glutamyl-gamma-aminobutyrate hydrolase family protein [Macrococcus brunensis]ULG72258.1 gamma-glutamyl-gamma-aminobutyrate hydrolase family protein [Macrococcus brunensis]